MDNYLLIAFVCAVLIDSLIGDPYSMPHPIRVFGNAISATQKRLNKGAWRKLRGAITWFMLVGLCYAIFFVADKFLQQYSIMWTIFTATFCYYGLSNRCLINEGLKVERILAKGDLDGARKQLSMIVGRDTSQLSATKIRSAVIETLSENLSDGVIAPLLYFVVGGVPLMMCYKMINTLDSMVGYKNEKYKDFGFVSAKMDDVANFIPARITALLMVVVSLSGRAAKFIFRYGNNHSSPNAGYPEAAIAGILDCRLGGTSSYFGKLVEKPFIGARDKELTHRDVITTCFINAKVALLAYLIIISIFYIYG